MKTKRGSKFWINWAIAISFIIALVCGVIGWKQLYETHPISTWTAIYLSVQMINLGAYPQDAWAQIPGILDFARFLMPIVILSAFINLALSLTKKQFDRVIIQLFYKKHYVIIGFNDVSELIIDDWAGYDAKKGINNKTGSKNKKRIVLIDFEIPKRKSDYISKRKIKFIDGNPEDISILKRAKIGSAAYIIINTNDDNTNLKIAEDLKSIYFKETTKDKNKEKINEKILIHFKDSLNLMAFKDLQRNSTSTQQLDFHGFNIYQKIAMKMIDDYSPDKFNPVTETSPPIKILFFGLNAISEFFIREAVIMYHFGNLQPLYISIVDEMADEKLTSLSLRYPGIETIVKFQAYSPNEFFKKATEIVDISVIYVFTDHDYKSLNTALQIRQIAAKSSHSLKKPVITSLLPINSTMIDFFPLLTSEEWKNTVTIDLHYVKEYCTHQYLIEDVHQRVDKIAEGIFTYWEKKDAQKRNKKERPWKTIPDLEKDNNRYPVRFYNIIARFLDFEITEGDQGLSDFDIDKIAVKKREICGDMEHRRWMAEKIIGGFVGGKIWSSNNENRIIAP